MTSTDSPPRVLVVSESEDDVKAVSAALGDGAVVAWADSGVRALDALKESPPRAVVFDADFSDFDCRAMCGRLSSAGTPLVAIVDNTAGSEAAVISSGAADAIVRPVDSVVLAARLRPHLVSSGTPRDGSHDAAAIADPRAAEAALDAEWRRCARDKRSLAALLVEVSGGGAAAARRAERVIRRACHRGGDVVLRYEAGQFLALLPRAEESGAQAVADRILRSIGEAEIDADGPDGSMVVRIAVDATHPMQSERSRGILERLRDRLDDARRIGGSRWVGGSTDRTERQDTSRAGAGARGTIAGNLLVVDDTPINAEILAGLLTGSGADVRVAHSGRDALGAVRVERPDLVLLDISMPEMDGYEVCRRMKADAATADVPVIFVSALEEPMDKVLAFEVGGADYVQKPFQPSEVLARVAYQLEIARLQADMRRRTRASSSSTASRRRSRRCSCTICDHR